MVKFRGSGAGNCIPEIVASILEPSSTEADESKKYFLQTGHTLQPIAEMFLEDNGYKIMEREAEVSYRDPEANWGIDGHIDAIVATPDNELILLEIKSITDKKWKQVESCSDWRSIYPHYYAQVQAYMGMSKIPKCLMLFLNRDNSKIIVGDNLPNSTFRSDCLVDYDTKIFLMLLARFDVAFSWILGKQVPDRDLCDSIGFCYFCKAEGRGVSFAEETSKELKNDKEFIRLIKDRRSLRRQMFAVEKKLKAKFEEHGVESVRADVGLKRGKAKLSVFEL